MIALDDDDGSWGVHAQHVEYRSSQPTLPWDLQADISGFNALNKHCSEEELLLEEESPAVEVTSHTQLEL